MTRFPLRGIVKKSKKEEKTVVLQVVKKHWITAICAAVLFVYFVSACTLNFSANPSFYSTDMYTDMVYAEECWAHKSIFPDGWIFGNQLYAVATPVLAALFYGIVGDHAIAMALAAAVMGILVIVTFAWMVKAIFPGVQAGLLGGAIFAALPLSFAGAVHEVAGWQLFFTMCSFYSCYAIAAFLAFGCYIRSANKTPKELLVPLIFAGIMAFGTGVQSLRQTLVMTCPLLAVEGLCILRRLWKKENLFTNTTFACLLLAVCNIAGVVFAAVANVPQVEIFGKIDILSWDEAMTKVQGSAVNALALFGVQDKLLAVLILLGGGFSILVLAEKLSKMGNKAGALCVVLMGVSVAGLLAVDTFTTMYIRSIYYFLLYPLVAMLGVAVFSLGKWSAKAAVAAMLVLLFAHGVQEKLPAVLEQAKQPLSYEETVSFLKEEGITTVFSGWNRAEGIAIYAKGSVKAAFWDSYKKPFVPVKYLCDPACFEVDPENCAYVFLSYTEADIAVTKAAERGVELKLLKHIAAEGVYIYTAEVNLMTK